MQLVEPLPVDAAPVTNARNNRMVNFALQHGLYMTVHVKLMHHTHENTQELL